MPRSAKFAILLIYALILFALSPLKPLWLDEIIQLTGTSGTTNSELIQHVARNAGGAPFGYLTQHWLISIAGTSLPAVRLGSILCAILSLAVLLWLADRLGVRGAMLAAALWMVCPLTLRYALEGRPYMQGVLFALLAVASLIRYGETGRVVWVGALTLSLTGAVYSQPFAVFAPLGFAAYSVWKKKEFRYAAWTAGAFVVAGLSFLPWLIAVRMGWHDAIARAQGGFEVGWPLAAVLLRELVGDGYLASIPALLLAAWGVRKGFALAAAVAATLVCGLVADAVFNYFLAIRQVLYLMPFLVLLMAEGAGNLGRRSQAAAVVLLALFFGASLGKDAKYQTDWREDWPKFTAAMQAATGEGCILLPVDEEGPLYEYVRPGLKGRFCSASQLAKRVVVPANTYTPGGPERIAMERLTAQGYRQTAAEQSGFGRVKVFER